MKNSTPDNHVYNAEYVFENTYKTENYEIKQALEEFSNEFSSIDSDDWELLFDSMNPDSIGRVKLIEAYIIATSKIILNIAIEHRCMFAQY